MNKWLFSTYASILITTTLYTAHKRNYYFKYFFYSIKNDPSSNYYNAITKRGGGWAYNVVQKMEMERAGEIKGGVTGRKWEGFPLPSAILRWTCRVTSWYFLSGLPSLLPAIFVSPPPPPFFFLPQSLTISGVVTSNKVTLPLSGNTFRLSTLIKSTLDYTVFAYLERFLKVGYLFIMWWPKTFIGISNDFNMISLKKNH